MAATCINSALLLGSLFSFSSNGAACLSAICFISSSVGMRPPPIEPAWGDAGAPFAAGGACIAAICFIGSVPGICTPLTAPAEEVAAELAASWPWDAGDCDSRTRYPIASPATKQIAAIPYTWDDRRYGFAVDALVGSLVMPYSPRS